MKQYAQTITKEQITDHIYEKSNAVASDFYREFGSVIDSLAEDIAISFTILADATDRNPEDEVSDADFQSANLFWNALNTELSAIELFIRGYMKEPAVLTRSALEIAMVACDLHLNPDKLSFFYAGKLQSTESIGVIKQVIPAIAPMWGQLSDYFAHVSLLHVLPQGSYKDDRVAKWVGGGFSKEHEKSHLFILSILTMTLDVVNDLIEFSLLSEIPDRRFWEDVEGGVVYKPLQRIRDRSNVLMEKINDIFEGDSNR